MLINKTFIKKIVLTVLLLSVFLFSSTGSVEAKSAFAIEASSYGFSIDDDYRPIYMTGVQKYEYLRDYDGDKHYTAVFQVLLRSQSNPSYYAFVYKIVTSPRQDRNWGFIGFGSYGQNYFNYDITTNISFPFNSSDYTITDYAPKNDPAKSTSSIGVGLDSSGPSISAGVSYDHSELSVISNTRTGEKKYNTYYKIRGSSNYVNGEISSYGMLMFHTTRTVWVDVKHEIQYQQQVGWDKTTSDGYVSFTNRY